MIKKITTVALISAAFLCSTVSVAATKCAKNQYWDGTKCVACKGNATCDGNTFKCKSGYMFEPALGTQACVPSEEVSKIGGIINCKHGYGLEAKSNKCTLLCSKNEFYSASACEPCPKNATCNGVDFTCKSGYKKAQGSLSCVLAPGFCVDDKAYKTGGTDTGCTSARPICVKGAKFSSAWRNEASGVVGDTCVECVTDNYCTKKYGNKKPVCNQKTYTCEELKCSSNQWKDGTKCASCPKNATCDGHAFSCKSYTYSEKRKACDEPHCNKTEYWNIANCEKCPANATCDGEKILKCEKGYTLKGNVCIASAKCVDDKAYKTGGTDTGCTSARPICVKGAKFSSAWRNEASGVAGDTCVECVTDNYCTKKYGNKKPVCNQKTYTCVAK